LPVGGKVLVSGGDATGEAQLAAEFKLAMRRLAATVCIVTTHDGARRYGMTATAVQSVSTEPPSMLVCLNKSASITAPLWRRGWFAVNLLRTDQADLVPVFSGKVQSEHRFNHGTWAELQGMPVLENAQASLICEQVAALEVRSHNVVVGEVHAVRVGSDISPLLYRDGKLAQCRSLD
jgi:flavin reductase (DIM6/NTAB) family NADH-FMN oxidoreductase RutF